MNQCYVDMHIRSSRAYCVRCTTHTTHTWGERHWTNERTSLHTRGICRVWFSTRESATRSATLTSNHHHVSANVRAHSSISTATVAAAAAESSAFRPPHSHSARCHIGTFELSASFRIRVVERVEQVLYVAWPRKRGAILCAVRLTSWIICWFMRIAAHNGTQRIEANAQGEGGGWLRTSGIYSRFQWFVNEKPEWHAAGCV